MSSPRSILLVKTIDTDDDDDHGIDTTAISMVPLGSHADIVETLRVFNTAPDGDPHNRSVLYGPGITVQLPMLGPDDPVNQLLVSLTDDEIAWPVLIRICRALSWKMMDPKSGRTFG